MYVLYIYTHTHPYSNALWFGRILWKPFAHSPTWYGSKAIGPCWCGSASKTQWPADFPHLWHYFVPKCSKRPISLDAPAKFHFHSFPSSFYVFFRCFFSKFSTRFFRAWKFLDWSWGEVRCVYHPETGEVDSPEVAKAKRNRLSCKRGRPEISENPGWTIGPIGPIGPWKSLYLHYLHCLHHLHLTNLTRSLFFLFWRWEFQP